MWRYLILAVLVVACTPVMSGKKDDKNPKENRNTSKFLNYDLFVEWNIWRSVWMTFEWMNDELNTLARFLENLEIHDYRDGCDLVDYSEIYQF